MTGSLESSGAPEALRRIGRYALHEVLGRGAMGVVYRGQDTLLRRDVAIKLMATSILDDASLRARLEREARAVARLSHPNLVTIFDLGYEDGAPYLVMELLRGQDLGHLLAAGEPLSRERRLILLLQVLAGLAHVHAAGVVHRDVKPANIFVSEDGRVRLLDFGLARIVASASHSSAVMGTADYMSPEQLEGREVDGRSDLFSCGAVLFELLSGWAPFHAESVPTIAYRVVHKEPDYGLLPADAAALRPVLQRALAKDTDRRYARAAEFARELRERAGLPEAALPADLALEPQPTGSVDPATGAAAPPVLPTVDLGPRSRRLPRARATLIGAFGAIAVGAAAILLWGPPRAEDSAPASPSQQTAALAASPSSTTPRERTRVAAASAQAVSPDPQPAPTQEPAAEPTDPPGDVLAASPAPAAAASDGTDVTPQRLSTRWVGYLTDESCKSRGAVPGHWDCVEICLRKGFRPMLAVNGALYYLEGVDRIRGDRNQQVVVEGALDLATRTITVSGASGTGRPD